MERSTTDPDIFISAQPEDRRVDLERVDAVIRKVMTGHPRVLWEGKFWGGTDQSIIGYGDYEYGRPGKEPVKWFIVGLAPQKNYISLYINAADEDGYLIKKHAERLGKVKVGSAAISFKRADDLDLGVLEEVVSMARDRMA
jgi:Domain of unknown function (DU1801)